MFTIVNPGMETPYLTLIGQRLYNIRICTIFIGTAIRRQPTMYKQAIKSGTVLRDYDEDVNCEKQPDYFNLHTYP